MLYFYYRKNKMKDIPGYEGLYAITEDGRVWSYPRQVVRQATATRREVVIQKPGSWKKHSSVSGYPQTVLWKENKQKGFLVHRLVAAVYIDNPNNKPYVCHKDDNPSNPHKDNLYWGDQFDNMNDMIKRGRAKNQAGPWVRNPR